MKQIETEIDQCRDNIQALAEEMRSTLPRGQRSSEVSLVCKGYRPPHVYFLVWNSGDNEDYKLCASSGKVRLNGNPRRRAARAFDKLRNLKKRCKKARSNAQDWQNRKRDLINRRLRENPEILEKMKALCEEALVSPPEAKAGKRPKAKSPEAIAMAVSPKAVRV